MRALFWMVLIAGATARAEPPAAWHAGLAVPTAATLQAHVSFLASDLLEGRDTPSRGLDIAAEYIAAGFRRAGLEAPVNGGYFQASRWYVAEPNPEGFHLSLESGGESLDVPLSAVVAQTPVPVSVWNASLAPVSLENPGALEAAGSLQGKVAFTVLRNRGAVAAVARLAPRLRKLNPAAWIIVDLARAGLFRQRPYQADTRPEMTVLAIEGEAAGKLAAWKESGRVSLRLAAWTEREVTLRNVVGVVPGSDSVLRDTYVVVMAHHDHVGVRSSGQDRIYNGANDDASGVAVMLETAAAIASLRERPKRSVAFLAVVGEEKGLLGSRYYTRNPVFALDKTVGALSLEVLGRTDAEDGPHHGRIAMTGHGYSTITQTLASAGVETGFTVYRHDPNSDAFFTRSDNAAFAEAGIPAHTLSTGYVYSDYHQPGDHWEKLDYPHLEKVSRLVTLGTLMLADSAEPPRWDNANPRTERFRKAAEALRPR